MEHWRCCQRLGHGSPCAPPGAGGTRGESKTKQPSQRRQTAIALARRGTADGVERQVDASPGGDVGDLGLEVLGTVIDRMVVAHLSQPIMLLLASRADRHRPSVLGQLKRRQPYA